MKPEELNATVLLPTYGRLHLLNTVAGMFERQTHPARQMVVINDDHRVRIEVHDSIADRVAVINIATRMTIPEKLNYALNAPSIQRDTFIPHEPHFFCVWDDDDIQHPRKLQWIAEAFAMTGAELVGFGRHVYFGPDGPEVIERGHFPDCGIDAGALYSNGGFRGSADSHMGMDYDQKIREDFTDAAVRSEIALGYVWSGVNYHVSASSPEHIENEAAKLRRMFARDGVFVIQPDMKASKEAIKMLKKAIPKEETA